MPIMVNFMCKNNMLTDITYNSVLIYVQIGSVELALLYAIPIKRQL